jgi:circadian clock protein KaiB
MRVRPVTYKFRLYIADNTENSEAARANLASLCRLYLADRHEIEIVDVLTEPKRALDDGILMTPTLIKIWPPPVRRIVGTLSRLQPVLLALGLGGSAG